MGGDESDVCAGIGDWGNFAVADQGIYFIPVEGNSIQFCNSASGETRTVVKLDKPAGFGMAASRDGRGLRSAALL